jgi:alpha-1,2-mannosyltransferase
VQQRLGIVAWCGACAAVLAVIVAVLLPLITPGDLHTFLLAGSRLLHGRDVYPAPDSPAVYAGNSFVYPYLSALPFVPLAVLPTGLADNLFFAVSVVALIATCLIAAEGDRWPALLVLCTTFTITGLQVGALSPLLLVGAVWLWRLRERPRGFGVLAAVVVTSKLFLAPLLVWLLLSRRFRAAGWAVAGIAVVLALGFAVGPLGPSGYAHLLSKLSGHEARHGFGLIGALMNVGLGTAAAQLVAALVAIVGFGGAYGRWRRTGDERVLFCAGVVASLLVSPVVWSHYLILLLAIPIVLRARLRWFIVLALCSWAVALPYGVKPGAISLLGVHSLGTWLIVAVVLAGLAAMTRRRSSRGSDAVGRLGFGG